MAKNPMSILEINLFGNNVNISSGLNYAHKNNCQAIVIPPEFINAALVERSKFNSRYKIIVAIDFEYMGKNYGMDKIKSINNQNIFLADGFDILLTPNKTMIETSKEVKSINEYFKSINQLFEIRWTIASQIWKYDNIKTIIKVLEKNPCNFIRTSPDVNSVSDIKNQTKIINFIKKNCSSPIKLSGNVNLELWEKIHNKIARLDVSVTQAQSLFHELNKPKEESITKNE